MISLSICQFECLNGADPALMTKKEYLIQFSKGPCSPTMILPGITGTKIVAVIKSCQKLQQNYPDIFANCGWKGCSVAPDVTLTDIPNPEYILWFPKFGSPMSLLETDQKYGKCFSKLFIRKIDFTKPIKNSLIENDAFTLRIFGDTPGTKALSDCGNAAISDFSPFSFPILGTTYFTDILAKLKSMGYKSGLTLQSLPYDWSLSIRNNKISERFKNTLLRLNKLSNKKVILMAHSLGNLNIQYQLSLISSCEKEQLIQNWVTLGYPSLGSGEPISDIIAGNPYFPQSTDLSAESNISFFGNSYSVFELIMPDYNQLFKNQKWFKHFLRRIRYENGLENFSETGFDWLPKLTDKCSPDQYLVGSSCRLGIVDNVNIPIIEINNKKYYPGETRKVFNEWPTSSESLKRFDYLKINKLYALENPGVPVISVILRSNPSIQSSTVYEDIFVALGQNRFPNISYNFMQGDGTADVNSLYAAPLKWAYEFDNRLDRNAKPVKVIDVCSLYNQRPTPYDGQNKNGEAVIKKNEFIGLDCNCIAQANSSNCDHSKMLNDNHLIDFLATTLQTNEIGYTNKFKRLIMGLKNTYLDDIADRCLQLDSESNFN